MYQVGLVFKLSSGRPLLSVIVNDPVETEYKNDQTQYVSLYSNF